MITGKSFLQDYLMEVILQKGNDKKEESWSIKMKEGTMGRAEMWIHKLNYIFTHEFYKLYFMISTKIIPSLDTEDNDV